MITFTCGRRTWGAENTDFWREDGTCSHCGSMNPDTVMQRAEAGLIEFGPTDKNYKAYIHEAVSDEALVEYKADGRTTQSGMRILALEGEEGYERWWQKQRQYLTGKQLGKFYFQHLSAAQRSHFIHLYNTKVMKIGYPGRFYVTPFFCKLQD